MKRFLTIALLSMLAGMANAADLSGARWYTIKVANGGYLSTKSDYLDGTYLTLSNTAEDTSDNGLWTYIGNDTEGYAFYNKARGENYVIGLMGNEANGRRRILD